MHSSVTYSSDHGVSWQLATPKQTSTSLTINGVSSAKAYKVRVRAKNASGYSGWRISASASPPVPDAVAEVRVVHQGSSLAVSWPVPTGASVYHVTYSDANPISWQLAASEHRSTSLIITGVESSKTYLVGLRAANAIGDWSGWVNSAPAAPPALSVADQVLEPQFWIRSGGAWDAGHGVRNADFAHFALGLCQGVSCPQPAWQSHRDNRTRKKAKRKWRPGRGMAARHRRQRP